MHKGLDSMLQNGVSARHAIKSSQILICTELVSKSLTYVFSCPPDRTSFMKTSTKIKGPGGVAVCQLQSHKFAFELQCRPENTLVVNIEWGKKRPTAGLYRKCKIIRDPKSDAETQIGGTVSQNQYQT
jgi:hypothetical protein